MHSHVLRPLYAIALMVMAVLITRALVVPEDFGVGRRGYMYGWHRISNEAEWKALPAALQPVSTCAECHPDEASGLANSSHASINCQDCHGPGRDHPNAPSKLVIIRDRALCLRCHAKLNYPNTPRGTLAGVEAATHNPGTPCADCHNPHRPGLGEPAS